MTTLQEEEELFGASLSKDFYQSSHSSPQNRPWLASSPHRSSNAFDRVDAPSNNTRPIGRSVGDDRRREPYELLDDVPPIFQAGRYPVEELYPAVDESGHGKDATGWRDDDEDRRLDRSRKAYSTPPSPAATLNSRYPIDDIVSEYSQDTYNQSDSYYSSSPSPRQHAGNYVEVAITESRSDSEISEYRPMSDERLLISEYRTVKEKAEATLAGDDGQYRYPYDDIIRDCDMIGTTNGRGKMISKTSMSRSNASVSTFDRLYDEESVAMEMDSHGYSPSTSTIEKYDSHIKNGGNYPHVMATSMSEGSDDYVSQRENSKRTFMSVGGDDYVSPRENSIRVNAKVDVNASTPTHSNRLMEHHPATPHAIEATSPMSQTTMSPVNSSSSSSPPSAHRPAPPLMNRPMSQIASSRVDSSSSPSSPLPIPPTPPLIKRRSMPASEIFRMHGADSRLGRKSGAYYSEKSASSVSSASSAHSSDSLSSDCSAIQDLASLQNRTIRSEMIDVFTSKPMKRREDPPTQDFGYYPQSEGAKEPEGYNATVTRHVTVNEHVNRQYEPPAFPRYQSGHHEIEHREYEGDDSMENNSMHGIDDTYDDYHKCHFIENASFGDSALHNDNKEDDGKGREAMGYKFRNGQIEQENIHATTVNNDGVSIISEDTGIQLLVKRQQEHKERKHMRRQRKNNPQQKSQKSESYYQVKQKDSMESEVKICFDSAANDKEGPKHNQQEQLQNYTDIKRYDSMEKEMSVDFDEQVNKAYDRKFIEEVDPEVKLPNLGDAHKTSPMDSISSPPTIKRKPFSFENAEVEGYNAPDNYENMGRFDDHGGSRSIVSESSYSSCDDDNESCASDASETSDTSDASEASDDPAFFPSKAISQMNLGRKNEDAHESDDLVEQACSHLSRGRNNDAIAALKEALQLAESSVNDLRIKLDNFFFQKKRGAKKREYVPTHIQDELENQLHAALRDSGSDMANILNNIGVVQEMMGDYQLAMNSFRDALDVYRNMCHRYENTGDRDVDRTVSNIMQMGIAARHHDKRMGLHDEADELAAQIADWLHSDNQSLCTQLQVKRLNVLLCVLDLETESLGQDHPAVAFTLLKKGELHLEMKHVDMAIKDTGDAVSILKKSLGGIHPEVGLALVKLGDMFNYYVGQYGGGCDDSTDNKYMALSLYQEALMPLRESFGKVNPHLGLVCNCLGILYSSRGELKQAMSSFYDALSSYGVRSRTDNRMTGENGQQTSCRPQVFFAWINVGGLHMMKSEWHLALRSYLKAHSAFRCLDDEEKKRLQMVGPRQLMRHALTLSKGHTSFDDSDTLVASVLHNIGKAQSMLHQYGKAIETLEEALRIHQVVAIRTPGNKQAFANSNSSQDVARILENIGEVQMVSGDLTSAFSRYVESLNLLRSSTHVEDSSIEVALVLGAIGKVHLKKGEYTEAKIVLKESMRMFEELGK